MARKDVHSLVSGMGGACSIVETIVREARDCGVSDEAIHGLTTEKGRKIIRGWVQSLKEGVRSALSLPNLILAAGFDWWNKNILQWQREDAVPTTLGEGELLHLNRHISTDDAEAEMKQRGFRPANAEELCDYATKNPDEQRKYPIIALGSVFVDPTLGDRYSPYLCEDGAERELDLNDRGIDWRVFCRFLAVRK